MNDRGHAIEVGRGTHDAVLARVRELTGRIRDGAAAAEEARTIRPDMVDAFLGAGISRILIPPRFGGYGLDLATWFDVVRAGGPKAIAYGVHWTTAALMIGDAMLLIV